jgi:hypothetical protein
MKPRVLGPGRIAWRARFVKLLAGHVRWLELATTLQPWTPEPRAPYPPMPYGGSGRQRYLPQYAYPRERPALAHPTPGPEAITDEALAEWIAADEFVRSGLQPKTARALMFIESFRGPA